MRGIMPMECELTGAEADAMSKVSSEKQVLSSYRTFTSFLTVFDLTSILLVGCAKKEQQAPTPPEVEITPVTQKDVPIYTECIAILDGYINAQIQPQVTGYLMAQIYREGTVVRKGEVLFEI